MPTTATTLERHVTVLERELRKMRSELKAARKVSQKPWWKRLAGRFKNDEIIAAGNAYRGSLARCAP